MLNALLLLTTFSGIAMAISFSLLLPEARCFATVGRDSLVFYALNDFVLKTVKFALFSVAHIPVATLPFAEQLCYALNAFVQRYMRWAIGDFSRHVMSE